MDKVKQWLKTPWVGYAAAACVAVVLYEVLEHFDQVKAAFGNAWTFLSPVVTGLVVAYLFDPVARFFENKVLKKLKKESARHLWGVVLTVVCLVLILVLLLVALIPSLAKSVSTLVSNWNNYTEKLSSLLEKAAAFASAHNINIDLSSIRSFMENSMSKLLVVVKDNAKGILNTIGNIGSGISNFAVGVLFGFCFLAAKKTLLGALAKVRGALFKKERIERSDTLFASCHRVFIRYIGCTMLDALIVGVAALIFLLAAQMPYAPLIAVVVALTNIIPTFGPMIGAAIGIFFLVLESPFKALLFFVFICILQGLDGMVIKPRLFSGSLGIPAVWTMVLIILGGKVAGMLGILLAIPVGAILAIIYNETIEPRLEKRTAKINQTPLAEEPGGKDT
ncbi:MAG: AI-2E family transporter [Clostridia bacterium]|nr:AI-2E family transporter [Clostridia bacterium]